jgi:hypothetical protein
MKNVIVWSVLIVCACAVSAFAQNNVVFDNQSGEPALVKLIGPTQTEVEVPNGAKVGVDAAAGQYIIKVRYGTSGRYRYSKGDKFDVKGTVTTRSETTITLHKVVAGNYDSHPIPEKEFAEGVFAQSAIQAHITSSGASNNTAMTVALQNPMWSWLSTTGKFGTAGLLEKSLVGDPSGHPTVVAKFEKPIQLDQVIKKWGKPQSEEKGDYSNTWFWISSYAFENFLGSTIVSYPKIRLLVSDGVAVQGAFLARETERKR